MAYTATRQPGRLSRWTARFIRVSLLPVICIGVPIWPLLAFFCIVPILSLLTIPLFVFLSAVLVYSLCWFTYLVFAQTDAPPSDSAFVRVLPFLPYSPLKCFQVTRASFLYTSVALRLVFPAVLDWGYRRVMVLGTQAGAAVVKEGILYGPPPSDKRLDVYLPPATSAVTAAKHAPSSHRAGSTNPLLGKRYLKHSTLFDESPPAVGPDGKAILDAEGRAVGPDGSHTPRPSQRGTAVIVFLPSAFAPISWTNNRKTYLQLALRLRRMGYCIVVPYVSYFPDSRICDSIVDVRLVLSWVGREISRYGGNPERIHLMGHGLSAHLALLTLTQEAVVLSREGILQAQAHRDEQKASVAESWQKEEEERQRYDAVAASAASGVESPPRKIKVAGQPFATLVGHSQRSHADSNNAWVDELATVDEQSTPQTSGGLAPGIVLPATSPFPCRTGDAAEDDDSVKTLKRLAKQLDTLAGGSRNDIDDREAGLHSLAASSAAGSYAGQGFPFPGTSQQPGTPSGPLASRRSRHVVRRRLHGHRDSDNDHLLDIPIPIELQRVEIYEPEIDVPTVAGLILFSGISDVIKGVHNEAERGVEDLSLLRRSCGPSHTGCLLHSPAHLLYAAKNLIDPTLLPPKVLLVHGGQDTVVPIEQSTLLKTLLVGIGVTHVRLRAYRKLGHAESIACLFLGMNKGLRRYMRKICQDLDDFLAV